MGVLLGGFSSLFYGIADFLGGQGARRAPAASIVLWSGVFSFPFIVIVGLLSGGTATIGDLLFGAGGGVAGAIGLVTLFAGLSKGHAAVVAPSAAVGTAVFPVAVAVLYGERPSLLAWAGIVAAVPAILLCSWVVERSDLHWQSLRLGVLAGLGFGGYTILLDRTSEASELLPLVSARASTMVVVLLLSFGGVWRVVGFSRVPWKLVAGNGILDVAGNVTLLLGLRTGHLALVAVASSFYPAVTVLMARFIGQERLRNRQIVGIIGSLAALAAIGVG